VVTAGVEGLPLIGAEEEVGKVEPSKVRPLRRREARNEL